MPDLPPPLPSGYAPIGRDPREVDAGHLRLLSIFHYAFAAVGVLGLGFLLLHFLFMRRLMSDPKLFPGGNGASLADVFPLLKWFYLGIGGVIVVGMALNALSGWCLGRQRGRVFCLVVAALDCLQIPFGTALGVFTLMVLLRPTVRDAYAGSPR